VRRNDNEYKRREQTKSRFLVVMLLPWHDVVVGCNAEKCKTRGEGGPRHDGTEKITDETMDLVANIGGSAGTFCHWAHVGNGGA
jgi:hypothetical protein